MPIVVGGLGLPEEGSLVTGGLGVSESSPNAMSATLAGSSSVVAVLTGAEDYAQHDGPATGSVRRPAPRVARLSATLAGSSSLTARLDYEIDVDVLLEQFAAALLLDVI